MKPFVSVTAPSVVTQGVIKQVLLWAVTLLLAMPGAGRAANFSTLFNFDLHYTLAGVVPGSGGNANFLFGTTADTSLSYGGAIFKVSVDGGAPQIVYQFQSSDGYQPTATLLRSTDQYLYGTTRYAPRVGSSLVYGAGTVFRVAQDGSGFTTLHTFDAHVIIDGTNSDGAFPDKALIEDATYLYGVTVAGGANKGGTIFRLSKVDGSFTVLFQFNAVDSNGANATGFAPAASLTLASDGRLYGTTVAGGANLISNTDSSGNVTYSGAGVLYSLRTDGSDFRVLHNFSALDNSATISVNADGVQPRGRLLEVTPGILVGLTADGGDPSAGTVSGYGTVFRYDIAGNTLNTLYAFNNDSGAAPLGDLVLGPDGLVYGLTGSGSSTATPITVYGSLFSIDVGNAIFTNVHPLAFTEGTGLTGGLVLAGNGDLYGTATTGGSCTAINGSGYGTVFRYSLTTNATSSGYATCTQPTNNGGGGAMSFTWLCLLSMLGLVPVFKRSLFV